MPVSVYAQTPIAIAAVQSDLSQGDNSALIGQIVTIEGIVTGVYNDLFFVQERTGGPWSGIAIYRPGHEIITGDQVRVTGTVSEYYDLTEIKPTEITVLSSNNPRPAPIRLTIQEASAEQWESVLVQINDLTVDAPPNQYGEWQVHDGSGVMLVDDKGVFYQAQTGETIPTITAIVDHAFGTYRLIPNKSSDIGGVGELPEQWTAISEIQGEAATTQLANSRVDTVGIVTAVSSEGFFLQDSAGDDNPLTSDAIYVYTGTEPDVTNGTCILVRQGLVTEFYGKTELSRVQAIQPVDLCPGQTVQPVSIPLPKLNTDPTSLLEPFEGMLVALSEFTGTVQGPTKRFANGDVEISIVADRFVPYLPGKRVYQSEPGDGSALVFLSNGLGTDMPNVAWGDQLTVGPATAEQPVLAILDYNFGKYQLLLFPAQPIVVTAKTAIPDRAKAAQADEFTLCTFNLEGMGQGSAQHPEEDAYRTHLHKRALVIADALHGCTILGLQETGAPEDAANLAALLTDEFGLPYSAVSVAGPNTENPEYPLTLSMLARSDQVEILHVESVQGCSTRDYDILSLDGICPVDQYPLFNRPPLIVDLEVAGEWGEPYLLTVVNNHWKSKVDDESVNVVQRTYQAGHVAALVQARLDEDPKAHIVVLGDLNDYHQSDPIEKLQQGTTPRLIQLYDMMPALDRYTYIFNGASQVLDHILITPGMRPEFAGIDVVHINADLPMPLEVAATSILRSSDHDPIQLTVRPQGAGWIGGNVGMPGVLISLRNERGSGVGVTMTDALGDFRFWGLIPGRYQVDFKPPTGLAIRDMDKRLQVRAGAGLYLQPPVQTQQTTLGISAMFLGAGLGTAAEIISSLP